MKENRKAEEKIEGNERKDRNRKMYNQSRVQNRKEYLKWKMKLEEIWKEEFFYKETSKDLVEVYTNS